MELPYTNRSHSSPHQPSSQVDREQVIGGVTFFYSPPPRAAVPYAAALKAVHERWAGGVDAGMCSLQKV